MDLQSLIAYNSRLKEEIDMKTMILICALCLAPTLSMAASGDFICDTNGGDGSSTSSVTKATQSFLNSKCDKSKPFSITSSALKTDYNGWFSMQVCCIEK
jgi:hypothetical protein